MSSTERSRVLRERRRLAGKPITADGVRSPDRPTGLALDVAELRALLRAVDRRVVALEDRAVVPVAKVQSVRDQVLGVGMNPAMRAVMEANPSMPLQIGVTWPPLPRPLDDDPGDCA